MLVTLHLCLSCFISEYWTVNLDTLFFPRDQWVNLLWPSDTIWPCRTRPALSQVMVGAIMMAPSHYLNLCWLIINFILWHSHKTNITGSAQNTSSWNWLKRYTCKIIIASHRDQWVNWHLLCVEAREVVIDFVSSSPLNSWLLFNKATELVKRNLKQRDYCSSISKYYQDIKRDLVMFIIDIWLTRRVVQCIEGFMQEICNSSALAMELRLSCSNPLIYGLCFTVWVSHSHSVSHIE